MLEILSGVIGFVAPFIPELFKHFQRKQDNEQEIKILTLQQQGAKDAHSYRMEEIGAESQGKLEIAELSEIYKPQQSFGVQMLDAAKGLNLSPWAMYPAFFLYVIVDALAATVRINITYASFAFYVAVKWAQVKAAVAVNSGNLSLALIQVWDEPDRAIVFLVLGFWFGHRTHKSQFGGSSSTSYKGA